MTTLWNDSSPEGADVLDDQVRCVEPVTIGATPYYAGHMRELGEDSIIGDTSADYGAWTAVSKGGDRLTVVVGLPADGTELGVDLVSGRVLATASSTAFLRYVGHGEFVRAAFALPLQTFGMLATGTTQDIVSIKAFRAMEIVGYQVVTPPIGGSAPASNMSLTLRDAIAGGGNAHGEAVACLSGVKDTGAVAFTAPFVVEADDAITLRGDGKDAQFLTFVLYFRPR